MTDVSIMNEAGVTFTFGAGEVDTVSSKIQGDIDQTPIPGLGPSESFLFDMEGVTKKIKVSGELFETDTSRTDSGMTTTILEQKQWLEQTLSGFQIEPVTFTSNYESQTFDGSSYTTTKIMAGEISFDEKAGNPDVLRFSMQLFVGSA